MMQAKRIGRAALAIAMVLAPVASVAKEEAKVDHAALGQAAGAQDFSGLATLCEPVGPPPDMTQARTRGWRMPPLLPAAQPFDNLVFLGNAMVSAWAIKTSAGLILVDALDNEAEAKESIEGGLTKLGLDPAQIKVLIITHAHGDHYGGASYLIGKYHPQVYMSDRDWQVLADPKQRIEVPGWGPPPARDKAISGRGVVTLGDTSVTLVETPGHTPGTISLIFPVYDHGLRHKAVLWGGTGFNFGPLVDRYQAYAKSAAAMEQEVLREKIDVFLSNHVKRDYADRKLAQMAQGTTANPFVLTPARTAKAFETFHQCALAQIDNLGGAASAKHD